jgi:hypothetical protein
MTGTCHVTLSVTGITKLSLRAEAAGTKDTTTIKATTYGSDGAHQCLIESTLLEPGYHGQQELAIMPDGTLKFRRETDT